MIDWRKSHCGVILCDRGRTLELMPEVESILDDLATSDAWWNDKLIDVKVHMLMPDQYPCIPNWHCDFRQRDKGGNHTKAMPSVGKMYAWISGAPHTEFRSPEGSYFVAAKQWHEFTQRDMHRGTASKEHTWRCFIRVIPKSFAHQPQLSMVGGTQRRHCQVYLDAHKFRW